MKIKLIVFLFLFCNVSFGQSIQSRKKLDIHPIIGMRIHNASGYLGGITLTEKIILTSPTFGLEVSRDNSPFSLSWQVDFNLALSTSFRDSAIYQYPGISKSRIEHQMHAYYKLRKVTLGLGCYIRRDEDPLTHASDFFISTTKGIQTSVGLPLGGLDIEWRYKANITPLGGILGWSQQSLFFLYHIQKQKQRNAFKFVKVNPYLGSRFFSTKKLDNISGEHFGRLAISPTLGIEAHFPKWNISINAEKDWYYSLNGGSSFREVKAQIRTSFLSVGYHLNTSDKHHLKFKAGLAFIQDSDLAQDLTINTPDLRKRFIYQAKGIGVAVSYNLFNNADVEVRHVFPWIGDELFSPTRFSIGLLYSRK